MSRKERRTGSLDTLLSIVGIVFGAGARHRERLAETRWHDRASAPFAQGTGSRGQGLRPRGPGRLGGRGDRSARTSTACRSTTTCRATRGNSSEFSKDGVSGCSTAATCSSPTRRAPRSIRRRASASCKSSTWGATRRARRTSSRWTSWATARDPPRGVRVRQGRPRAAAPVLDRRPRLVPDGR